MSEEDQSQTEAQPVYHESATGPVKLDTEQAKEAVLQGRLQEIPKEQALQEKQSQFDKSLAESTDAVTPWSAAAGFVSGASMHMGAPLHIALKEALEGPEAAEFARHLWAGQKQLGTYKVAEAAGMLASMKAFAPAEKAVASLIPETTSVLGAMGRTAVVQGTSLGVQGAITSLGTAIEDASIQNKELTTEAAVSSLEGGFLVGSIGGAAFGAAGELVSRGAPKLMNAIDRATAGGAEEAYLKRVGIPKGAVENPRAFVPEANAMLEKEGLSLNSESGKVAKVAAEAVESNNKLRFEVAKEFDKASAGPRPMWSRFADAVKKDVIGETAAMPGGLDKAAHIDKWLRRAEPPWATAEKYNVAANDNFVSKRPYRDWVAGRDSLVEYAQKLPQDVRNKVINAYDSELRSAMEEAELGDKSLKGASGRYQSAEAGRKVASEIGRVIEEKHAVNYHNRMDPMVAGGVWAAAGHPISGMAYALSRGGLKGISSKVANAMADTIYKVSDAGRHGLAVTQMKGRIGTAARALLHGGKLAAGAGVRYEASRKALEADIDRVHKEMQRSPQDRVQQFSAHLHSLPLAQTAAMKTEAVLKYANSIVPPDQATVNAMALRPVPKPVGLTPDEHAFMRQMAIIKDPYKIIKAMESGNISRDEVTAVRRAWPEFYNELVSSVQSEVVKLKQSGKSMDIGRISQLSILLDAPMDPIMQPDFVQAVNEALNAPEPQKPMPQPASSSGQNTEEYQTPSEAIH